MMKRIARIGIGLAALGCASGAVAQSFQRSLTQYRSAKAVCAETYQARTVARCDAACQAAAAARQTKCLAGAEERYRAALRRELRPRR
jgi:hypothetical protein